MNTTLLRKCANSALCMVAGLLSATLLYACSSTKHVPAGQILLDNVKITLQPDSCNARSADGGELYNFLRQQPNHKVLGFAKLQLATYSLSGRDTTKWYNRWLRRMGQAPVIYNQELTELSRRQLRQAMVNRGYLNARVTADSLPRHDKKRMDVHYSIFPGCPHVLRNIATECQDTAVAHILRQNSDATLLHTGNLLDRSVLDAERGRITDLLRNHGYYGFNRDNISFIADTAANSLDTDLTLSVKNTRHLPYSVRNVYFVTNYNGAGNDTDAPRDTVRYKGIYVLYGRDHYLKPDILEEKCHIVPGRTYNASQVARTYEDLSQLGILKFVNIEMQPVAQADGQQWLDAYILMSRNPKQGITVEVEGTNSEGDLGFGLGLTYRHRNLAHRSELLTAKLRGSYESLSGNLDGLINNRYTELAGEVGITFPKFEAPFLSKGYKQSIRAQTEFALSANYQERPEYTRVIAGMAWRYKWSGRSAKGVNVMRTLDFVDINYVYLPYSTLNFIDQIAPDNPLLRYSYEDHFIMRTGYTYYRTNRRIPTATNNSFTIQPSISTLRVSGETAGNLLYALSTALGQKRSDGAYKLFGIQYAQYVKGEADWTHVRNLNSRNAIAMHVSGGVAYPYGNSTMVPFEKRFYAGGANSVRGWSVRTLGPGRYASRNNVLNFINQCGDIALNLSLEYRAKLFWVFEGALFLDAGNVWTIKNYQNQPGGLFKFDSFYKELAAGYGIGLRMDFTYFLLRLDLGMKAHDPAIGAERWPLIHPNWNRDATFHFAVGYPF